MKKHQQIVFHMDGTTVPVNNNHEKSLSIQKHTSNTLKIIK